MTAVPAITYSVLNNSHNTGDLFLGLLQIGILGGILIWIVIDSYRNK